MAGRTQTPAENFPLRLVTLAIVLTLLMVTLPAWQLLKSYSNFHKIHDRHRRVQDLVLRLQWLSEVLTMNARMTVATGDNRWPDRYRSLYPNADRLWQEATNLAPAVFQGNGVLESEAARNAMTQIEAQAMGARRAQDRQVAMALLTNEQYENLKRTYLAGLESLLRAVNSQELAELDRQRKRSAGTAGILLVGAPLLLLVWLMVVRVIRQHLAERAEWETMLRESEEINRTLLASLPQSVFFKDRDLVFQGVNDSFARGLERKPEEIIGKTDLDFFPRAMAEKYREDDRRVLAEKQVVMLEESNVIHGEERIVEVIKAPVIDEAGAVIGLVGLFNDVTDRKRSEEQLREFAARLEQNNRELQEFAYVASHDLQEPLRKVRTFGDRLMGKHGAQLPAEGRDYLERMLSAARRMQGLIEALLAYSRITTQAQPFAEVDLNKTIREVLSDLEVRLEQTKGAVTCDDLGTIEADPTQMRQVFQNLIGNALKFHKPGVPPEIRISRRLATDEAPAGNETDRQPPVDGKERPVWPCCQILVQDNGIGFDEKYSDRIFQVFQRLHGRGAYEGTGVGLAICRKIVQRHGGEITAQSRPGEGAVFVVTLPVKRKPVTKEATGHD